MTPSGSLIETIERHLAEHPHAADSVEGVARWWIAGYRAEVSRQDVEEALEVLVQRGRLRSVRLADGNTLYSSALPRDPGSSPSV
jgi:hypothetical protein